MTKRVKGIPDTTGLLCMTSILFACLFIMVSCKQKAKSSSMDELANTDLLRITKSHLCIDTIQQLIQSGDLIMRTGIDFTSQALKQFCQTDPTYSHCGIVLKENDSFFVYHAIGGETNPNQTLQREWLPVFCDGNSCNAVGIFRFIMDSTTLSREKEFIKKKYADHLLFDMSFDLKTDNKMYCSEFVAKTLIYAFQNNQLLDTTFVQQYAYFAPDNIFKNKNCTEIHRFNYSSK